MRTVELVLPEDDEEAGLEAIAFVDEPAILVDFFYFNAEVEAPKYVDEISQKLKTALVKLVNILGRNQDEIFGNIVKRKPIEGFSNEGWSEHIEYKFMKKLFSLEDVEEMNSILQPYLNKGDNVFTFYDGTPWLQIKYRKSPEGKVEIISQNKVKIAPKTFSKEAANFKFIDEDQRIVISPLMIPDKLISRIDKDTNEQYQVFFTADTIASLSEKYMKDLKLNDSNIMHNPDNPTNVTMMQSWIVSHTIKDKSAFYGFSVPSGTWMGIFRVKDDSTWNKIKSGELRGMSVEGSFGQIER